MSYLFGAVSAIAQNNGSTPYVANLPPGFSAGSLLLARITARLIGATTITLPTGYTLVMKFTSGGFLICGKIAGASETPPSIVLSSSDTSQCSMCFFTGNPASMAAILDGTPGVNEQGASTNPTYDAASIGANNELVLLAWHKRELWTSSAAAGFTTISDDPYNRAGSTMSSGWGYQIQTTKSNIASGSVTITGGGNNTSVTGIAAFVPGAANTLSLLPQRRPRHIRHHVFYR